MPEFTNKFSSIEKLNDLCRKYKIKIGQGLIDDIERVRKLYERVPESISQAQEGLESNKEKMEKIMHSSSNTLSLKIRAFEKKYIESYL